MKFRVVAEPNMDIFSSDIRLRTFIREVTELTVSIVTKQCQEEIAILVQKLVTSLTSSMEVRVKLIVETIIEQIAALCLEDSMTACYNLQDIKEKICFPRPCEPHGNCDNHKHHRDTYSDSDKHKHSHDNHSDFDKHKHAHDNHSDFDKHKHHDHHGDFEKHKHGDKHYTPDTPTKKYT